MLKTALSILFALMTACMAASAVMAQGGAENRGFGFGRERAEDEVPKNVRESREKMRIEKETHDFDELMGRGQEVVRLTERIDLSFKTNGRLSNDDLGDIEAVEKDVKKIRSDLGGTDDARPDDSQADKQPSVADAVDMLKTSSAALFDQMKKNTRFTISAAAIESTNTVLKITKFLRLSK